jgi:hypothetical protein
MISTPGLFLRIGYSILAHVLLRRTPWARSCTELEPSGEYLPTSKKYAKQKVNDPERIRTADLLRDREAC